MPEEAAIKAANNAGRLLPPIGEAYAWSHVQVSGDGAQARIGDPAAMRLYDPEGIDGHGRAVGHVGDLGVDRGPPLGHDVLVQAADDAQPRKAVQCGGSIDARLEGREAKLVEEPPYLAARRIEGNVRELGAGHEVTQSR